MRALASIAVPDFAPSISQAPSKPLPPQVEVTKVDYTDIAGMTKHLRGTEVVLSFIVGHLDPEGIAQKNLVDACIAARVKRFAPSEWSM